jgi:hypothetical protein
LNKSFGFYGMVYVGYAVLIIAISIAAIFTFEAIAPDLAASLFTSGTGSSVGFVLVILPPLMVAQRFYTLEQRRTTRREGWILAVLFTGLAFVVGAAFAVRGALFDPASAESLRELGAIFREDMSFTVIFVSVFALFILLINKLFIWAGIRGEIKKAEREAIKAGRDTARNG